MNWILRPFRWFGQTSLAHSLRFRLILLVLLASLPSLGLLLVTAAQQRDDAIAVGQEESRRLARLAAADQSNVSSQIETVLLATAGLLGDTPEGCGDVLRRLVVPSNTPLEGATGSDLGVDGATFAQVVVLNNDLSEFCVGSAGGGLLSEEDSELASNALEQGRLVTGNIRTSSAGSMVITYAMPVAGDDGQNSRVILATLEIFALTRFALEANLPEDSFIVVFNDDGVLEQRYPARGNLTTGDSMVGTPIVNITLGIPTPEGAEERPAEEIDGQEFVFGTDDFWTPGPQGNLTLSYTMVGFPESVVVQGANQKFNENLGKLGIAAVIALVAAWIGADLFVGRDSETRKGQIRNLYHAFSTGNVSDLEEIIGPSYVDHTPSPGQAEGTDGLRQNIAAFRAAFPDGQIYVRELLADQDKVVARVTLSGTQTEEYFGVPPSGIHQVASGVEIFQFAHGMIVNSWSMFGELKPKTADVEIAPVEPPGKPGLFSRWIRRKGKSKGSEIPT